MRKIIQFAALAALVTGCFAPAGMQMKVAPLGEEVPGTTGQYLYALPQTVLKVELACQEMKFVPGPYREYAEKYLGITEVIRSSFSSWQILDVAVSSHAELDPEMVFQVNVLDGEFDENVMAPLVDKGAILDGTELVKEEIKSALLGSGVIRDYMSYKDLGIESNFAERTETMYKTIVTDTSFVKVPVDRTITEQKSPPTKAKEAADFILELRTRRFELLTGDYEVYPQGVAMEATLAKLDELEASYLTLFTGKTFGKTSKMSWFIVPGSGKAPSTHRLGMFSEQLGFVPADLMEGTPLEVTIAPLGKTGDMGVYYAGKQPGTSGNELFYRLPDVVDLKIMLGEEELSTHRISVYQSGALITIPVK
ncbi:MAG: DUF4831 family protein [Bacteroidota bacterium]